MLKVENLHVYYGHIHAVQGISFSVEEGEILTLIGANGAGKSTTLKAIMGLLKPKQGSITFDGQPITRIRPEKVITLGIGYVPEGRRIFPVLTTEENLEIGAFSRKDLQKIEEDKEHMFEQFPVLKERRDQLAGSMSGGEQQMLAIARAMMSRPRMILMDEPSLGLAPILVEQLFELIAELNRQGTTILLSEQNANSALQIANRCVVLETGTIALQGTAEEMRSNNEVQRTYLGI
ncbi:MAG: ABC transporter ATP-binding protein [Anaerolineales bacterium]|nr:ABC transporter ATP-binding protein [Anaerolineales bacterium]